MITPTIEPVPAGVAVGNDVVGYATGAGFNGAVDAMAVALGAGEARSAAEAGPAMHAIAKTLIVKKICAEIRAELKVKERTFTERESANETFVGS